MTRMRNNRSDWDDYGAKRKAAEVALRKLHSGVPLTDSDRAAIAALDTHRDSRRPE